VDLAEAVDFIRQVHLDHPALGPVGPRLTEVRAEVAETGIYTHTATELTYGAKLAWRNASRCIGRLYWQSLVVRDRRHVRTADGIFAEVIGHLRAAGDRCGRTIRPVLTVFAPAAPGRPYSRIWNEQLIRYAGYRRSDGSVVGDPRNLAFTEAVREQGWHGKGEAFDVLPLIIQTPVDGVCLFDLPDSVVWEVPLGHPELSWFADLGLRWHAVPAISHMRMVIGGISYPLAPFSGWYLGAEIGARNLADHDRYNMLPVVAHHMGLDTTTERSLWRDRALVEVNRAVLWSFDRAGVRISDHHTESHRFLNHVAREERAGRPVPADWTWIVPPISGSVTPVYHRYYAELDLRPNFYLDPEAASLAQAGHPVATPTRLTHRVGTTHSAAAHSAAAHTGQHTPRHLNSSYSMRARVPEPRLPLRPACPPVTRW
jgi:nitric-oxide synthase